jgi:hypothetical protein
MSYAITHGYDLKDEFKADGAVFDKDAKAWIVSDEMFAKYDARTSAWSGRWWSAWQKCGKTKIA